MRRTRRDADVADLRAVELSAFFWDHPAMLMLLSGGICLFYRLRDEMCDHRDSFVEQRNEWCSAIRDIVARESCHKRSVPAPPTDSVMRCNLGADFVIRCALVAPLPRPEAYSEIEPLAQRDATGYAVFLGTRGAYVTSDGAYGPPLSSP